MPPGDIDVAVGVLAGLDGAAAWVADALGGMIDSEMVAHQAPKVVNHLEVYLEHEAAVGHPNRTQWEAALASAREL
jgi:hypothetical protein